MKRRALFLDRDGTVIHDKAYISRPRDVQLMANAAAGIRRWSNAGYVPIVVSNQSGIARGMFTLEDLDAVNDRMELLLAKEGVQLKAIYCCPHHPEGKVKRFAIVCPCRKPQPGMLHQAAKDHHIDLKSSVIIGDAVRDVLAGMAVGANGFLLGRDAKNIGDAAKKFLGPANAP